ncbi:MAG: rRNA methyltransferase [bacterium]|nr:rRNA methyltransferase [bacterium]
MSGARHTILPEPSAPLAEGSAHLREALNKALPLRPKHRAALPGGIARLSNLLTVDRDQLPPDYMSRPEHLAAYLHWFLPWNVQRQGRLLEGLSLDLPAGARILDLGAGPFTFLVALWLARPELRERELRYLAVDRAEPALKAGRRLFQALAGDDAPWHVDTSRRLPRTGRADLLVAANYVNELEADRAGRQRGPDLDPAERTMADWERLLDPAGRLLVVEPGVRTAAARLVRLRAGALARGWRAIAPCPHQETCPVPGRHGGSWCHFAADAVGTPRWLAALGKSAKLPKERVSLSFLLMTRDGLTDGNPGQVRVVSDTFSLPDRKQGCYGCSDKGLVLLRSGLGGGAGGPVSGDLVRVRWPDLIERDPRSRALVVDYDVGSRRRRRP